MPRHLALICVSHESAIRPDSLFDHVHKSHSSLRDSRFTIDRETLKALASHFRLAEHPIPPQPSEHPVEGLKIHSGSMCESCLTMSPSTESLKAWHKKSGKCHGHQLQLLHGVSMQTFFRKPNHRVYFRVTPPVPTPHPSDVVPSDYDVWLATVGVSATVPARFQAPTETNNVSAFLITMGWPLCVDGLVTGEVRRLVQAPTDDEPHLQSLSEHVEDWYLHLALALTATDVLARRYVRSPTS